ncbi:MAG TPA: tripartite tricarboxylate transporter substrate-binding protein [Hyphomicrobiaceae bacterium]|nr:tripartite tricarboxylate transporter substrate-binding protein [Hyphomicrobiaceae bacterium]
MYSRRHVLKTGLAGSATLALPFVPFAPAWAQALTSLEMFIPAAPGGGWDGTGRAIELAMRTDGIIKEFKFEHVPGAGGAVGLPKFLAKKGQGDAVMVAGMVMIGATVANNSPVQLTQATPIMRLTAEYEVIVVPAGSPHKSMKDLIAAFKADPGKVSWAGGSAGGTDHILAGLIAKAVGVDPKRVAYVAYAGGGPAQAALLGNQVTCGVSGYSEFAEQIKAGKLRALAISSEKRQEGIDAPTLHEQGVAVDLANWRGVFGAPGITPAQQKALIDVFTRMTEGPTWKAELKKREWTPIYLAGDAFGKYVVEDTKRITGILTDLGLKKA